MANAIILKITEEEKAKIEEEKAKTGAKITNKITENNKVITLNKKAMALFKNSGVELDKNYYSYNSNSTMYNTIYEIAKKNADLFILEEK